nr:hypothetical protein [Tanacetum cinerariifolium]
MTVTSAPPAILLSDKRMTITNLHILVLVILDVDEMNYSSWVYFFKNHYLGFELLEHLLGNLTAEVAPSTPMPPDSEWLKVGSIILSWIFTTILGSPISKDDIVNIALAGLSEKYDHVTDIIIDQEPFLDLKTVHSIAVEVEGSSS